MSVFEYIKNFYGRELFLNQIVYYKGERGIVLGATHYVEVNLDSDKPRHTVNIHPQDQNLEYTNKAGVPRKLTRSQKRYQEYIDSECCESFSEWLRIKEKTK